MATVRHAAPSTTPQRRAHQRSQPKAAPTDGALTTVAYWTDRQAEALRLPAGGQEPAWRRRLADHLPLGPDVRCLEVGGVPGSLLLYFADHHGYRCATVDSSPRVHAIRSAFAQFGHEVECFQADFRTWQPERQFDFVYSCGFVEHFLDYASVIRAHWDLVAPGGLLVLSTPTLTPYQLWLRRIVYTRWKREEVYSTHVLDVMSEKALCREASQLPESKILASGYTRQLDVWIGPDTPGVRRGARRLFPLIRRVERLGRKWAPSSRWYSSEAFVAAAKSPRCVT
jgi:cyclopropane fatty-acyl-phospholipid synthase-like methyltransferase